MFWPRKADKEDDGSKGTSVAAEKPANGQESKGEADKPKGGSVETSLKDKHDSIIPNISHRLDAETQMAGNLWKKDTAGSASWNERYFVLKDGFLMYYPPQKTPMATFDMHPKGVVPLDGVEIETVRAGPTKQLQSSLRISHNSFGTKSLLLCAHDDAERDKWMAAMTASRFVTYSNAVAGAAQIESLKRAVADAQQKQAQAAAMASRKHEQLAKLVSQQKALLASISAAEKKHGIVVDIDFDIGDLDSLSSRNSSRRNSAEAAGEPPMPDKGAELPADAPTLLVATFGKADFNVELPGNASAAPDDKAADSQMGSAASAFRSPPKPLPAEAAAVGSEAPPATRPSAQEDAAAAAAAALVVSGRSGKPAANTFIATHDA